MNGYPGVGALDALYFGLKDGVSISGVGKFRLIGLTFMFKI